MKPTPVVAFAGTDQTCLIERAVLRHGRDDASSQPAADSATLDVVGIVPAGVDIGTVIAVDAVVAGASHRRFSGRITDIGIGWRSVDQPVARIIAIGELATMGRRVIGDVPWPAESDGARATRAIELAGVLTDPLRSDPGTVQVIARDVDAQPALTVAQDAATDGNGMMWQAKDGAVLYADALHRRADYGAELALDACILPLTVQWAKTLEGLVNDLRIGWGTAGGSTVHLVNPASVDVLGTFAASLTTRLASESDATARGQLMLNRQDAPAWVLSGVSVWLELIGAMSHLTAAENEALTVTMLGVEVHDLVTVTGLPAGSPYTGATLWVEGWTETIDADSWRIDFAVSDYCRSAVAPRWDDVPLATTWDTIDAGLRWDDAHCLPPTPPAGRWNDVASSLRWDQTGATTWDAWS